jgi:hypothetical protein
MRIYPRITLGNFDQQKQENWQYGTIKMLDLPSKLECHWGK